MEPYAKGRTMGNLNEGINFNSYNFSDKYEQIGGEKAENVDKINYSDGLTKKELKNIDEKYGNKDGNVSEDEFVEACLEDDTEVSDINSKSKSKLKELFQKYLSAFTTQSEVQARQEKAPVIKLKSDTNLPKSLQFGTPKVSISDIKTGDKEGSWYSKMTMDGKTYTATDISKNHNGCEKYVMTPEPKDGSKIVIEKNADGTQTYTVYGTDKKAFSQLELDKEGKAKSIFRYKSGRAYEREYYNNNVLRRYERDENGELIASKDYEKKSDGTIDVDKPTSSQTYVELEEVGKKWATRKIYEYDENGKQSVKENYAYDYKQEKDENGELTGKLTRTKNIYEGDTQDDNKLISSQYLELMEGILTNKEENEPKNKKTTKTKINSDGSSTITITEGDKKTVIEKDKYGKIQSKKVTENGTTKTTTYEDGKEKETVEDDLDKEGYPDTIQGVLSKLKTDKLPKDVADVISLVSEKMQDGTEITKDAETQERKKEEGEKANEYKSGTTNESGSKVTYTSGKQEFADRTNTYIEVYEGNDTDGQQLQGCGLVEYENGEFEIHYDTFKDGKVDTGRGVVINEKDKTITLYITDKDGEVKETTYKFDGTKI